MTPEERSDKLLNYVGRIATALERIASLSPPPKLSRSPIQVPPGNATKPLKNPDCPQCGQVMLLRKGRESGEAFWGCRSYPECKGTRRLVDGRSPQTLVPKISHEDDDVPY